jgi:hypothetical protein
VEPFQLRADSSCFPQPHAVSAHAKLVEHPLETYFCPMDKRLNTDDTVRVRTCYPSTVSKGTIWCILYACNRIIVYGIRVVLR